MKKTLGIALAVVMAQSAFCQVDQKRMEIINDTIYNRFVDQSDGWWEDGDYPRIIQMLWILFLANPDNYETATDLGWMLANCERYHDELAVYVQYRQANPSDPEAAYPEANFYFQNKAYEKVPPLLEGTLKKGPHANSFRILAHAYDKMGLLQDSKRVWQVLIARDPKDEVAKQNLKRVEAKIKDSR